jgi:hypothetical protein
MLLKFDICVAKVNGGRGEKVVLLNGQQVDPHLCKLIFPTLYLMATKPLLVSRRLISMVVLRLSMIILRSIGLLIRFLIT